MILVNATAATEGGATTVLKQLITNLPDSLTFIVFTSIIDDILPNLKNVKYVNPRVKSGFKRLYWDNFGLNKWCKVNHVRPDLIISMQNTGVKIDGDIKQLIYYHQTVPLYDYSWSIFKKSERSLWFYKNIYPFFVKQHVNENTIFVVQFDWIRQKLVKQLSLDSQIVHVVKPTASEINDTVVSRIDLAGKFNIFYPASYFTFKNHLEIVNALYRLKKQNLKIDDIKIYFTLDCSIAQPLVDVINGCNLSAYFQFIGGLSFEQVLQYYKSCDLVVLPSYLESFGLPLVEAAKFGKKILAADLDYAHEVLTGYNGVRYLPIHNPRAWGDAIFQSMEQKEQFDSWEPEFGKKSWQNFFQLVENFIRK